MKQIRNKMATMESITFGNCAVALTLDTRYKDENNRHHCSIRFTVNGDRYYLHLGYKYNTEEFTAINKADGRGRVGGQSQNFQERIKLLEIYNNYVDLVRDLTHNGTLKSIDNIRAILTGRISTYGKESVDTNINSFIGVWDEVIAKKKASTADNYRDARNSFVESKVYDEKDGYYVSIDQVKSWIDYLKKKGRTQTTIGIYLRAIRVAFNACINRGYMLKKDYPFSPTDPSKIKIPVGNSRRDKFFNVDQMTELYKFYLNGYIPQKYKTPDEIKQSLALFLAQYLCNGCNLYDIALMRYNDYFFSNDRKAIRFLRHKPRDISETTIEVIVPILPPLKKIMDDWAAPVKKDALIFPFLLGDILEQGFKDDSKKAKNRIHQENHNIGDRMKKIAEILDWDVRPSSTYARHSFATNMSREKVSLDYISFAMGHSIGNRGQITKRYIAPYSIEEQMRNNSYLLALPEMKSLRQQGKTKNEIIKMVKESMSREELVKLLLEI